MSDWVNLMEYTRRRRMADIEDMASEQDHPEIMVRVLEGSAPPHVITRVGRDLDPAQPGLA